MTTSAAPPENNLKKLLWGEIGSLTEKHGELFKGDTVTKLHIQRSAQSFLTGVTIPMSGTESQREAKFSGKHAPHLLFILDEGDAIGTEVYAGIESCMSGGHARLLVMFNPKSEVGAAYRMIRDGRANIIHLSAFNHPNVISGRDEIPGAVTRETTIRRINEWCRPLLPGEKNNEECFVLPKFLEGQTAKSQSGDYMRFITFLSDFNGNYAREDEEKGLHLAPPNDFEQTNRAEIYLQRIKSLLTPDALGKKRLIIGRCEKLRSSLQNLPADLRSLKIEEFPAVAALAYAVHSLSAVRPWLQFLEPDYRIPTTDDALNNELFGDNDNFEFMDDELDYSY